MRSALANLASLADRFQPIGSKPALQKFAERRLGETPPCGLMTIVLSLLGRIRSPPLETAS